MIKNNLYESDVLIVYITSTMLFIDTHFTIIFLLKMLRCKRCAKNFRIVSVYFGFGLAIFYVILKIILEMMYQFCLYKEKVYWFRTIESANLQIQLQILFHWIFVMFLTMFE